MSNSTIDTIITFVNALIYVYILLILIQIVLSWIQLPYNLWLARLRDFLDDTTGPYLRFFRRFVPSFGPLDLSPMVALVVASTSQRRIVQGVVDGLRPRLMLSPGAGRYPSARPGARPAHDQAPRRASTGLRHGHARALR